MLSMLVSTAILVVALPQYRISALTMMRSTALMYGLGAYAVVMLSGVTGSTAASLFNGIVTVDSVAVALIVISLITAYGVIAFYSADVTTPTNTPYVIGLLIAMMLVGTFYLATGSDMITIAISLEIQSFAVYSITSAYRWHEGATSAGLMYFMLGAFSSALVLLGIAMLYAYSGVTAFDELMLIGANGALNDSVVLVGIGVLASGLLFKVTAAPYHHWGPDVYDRVPTSVTVLINIMPKFGIMVLLTRLTSVGALGSLSSVLIGAALLSWWAGAMGGLAQTRIKRLLAFSGVNHVGWMLMSLVVGGLLGYGALGFYLMQYSLTTTLSFLALIGMGISRLIVEGDGPHADVESVGSIGPLWRRSTLLAVAVISTLFSAAGIPPFIGFYAKLAVLQGMLFSGYYVLMVLGVLASVVSAGYYLSVVSAMLFQGARTALPRPQRPIATISSQPRSYMVYPYPP